MNNFKNNLISTGNNLLNYGKEHKIKTLMAGVGGSIFGILSIVTIIGMAGYNGKHHYNWNNMSIQETNQLFQNITKFFIDNNIAIDEKDIKIIISIMQSIAKSEEYLETEDKIGKILSNIANFADDKMGFTGTLIGGYNLEFKDKKLYPKSHFALQVTDGVLGNYLKGLSQNEIDTFLNKILESNINSLLMKKNGEKNTIKSLFIGKNASYEEISQLKADLIEGKISYGENGGILAIIVPIHVITDMYKKIEEKMLNFNAGNYDKSLTKNQSELLKRIDGDYYDGHKEALTSGIVAGTRSTDANRAIKHVPDQQIQNLRILLQLIKDIKASNVDLKIYYTEYLGESKKGTKYKAILPDGDKGPIYKNNNTNLGENYTDKNQLINSFLQEINSLDLEKLTEEERTKIISVLLNISYENINILRLLDYNVLNGHFPQLQNAISNFGDKLHIEQGDNDESFKLIVKLLSKKDIFIKILDTLICNTIFVVDTEIGTPVILKKSTYRHNTSNTISRNREGYGGIINGDLKGNDKFFGTKEEEIDKNKTQVNGKGPKYKQITFKKGDSAKMLVWKNNDIRNYITKLFPEIKSRNQITEQLLMAILIKSNGEYLKYGFNKFGEITSNPFHRIGIGETFSINVTKNKDEVLKKMVKIQKDIEKHKKATKLISYKVKRGDNPRTILWKNAKGILKEFPAKDGGTISSPGDISYGLLLTLLRDSEGNPLKIKWKGKIMHTPIKKIIPGDIFNIVIAGDISKLLKEYEKNEGIISDYNKGK